METIDARELKEKPQTSLKVGLLTDLLKEYTAGEAFLSYFPEVITSVTTDSSKYSEFFSNILMATKLSISSQITMALSLYLYEKKEVS